jgi:hypothetical protein
MRFQEDVDKKRKTVSRTRQCAPMVAQSETATPPRAPRRDDQWPAESPRPFPEEACALRAGRVRNLPPPFCQRDQESRNGIRRQLRRSAMRANICFPGQGLRTARSFRCLASARRSSASSVRLPTSVFRSANSTLNSVGMELRASHARMDGRPLRLVDAAQQEARSARERLRGRSRSERA